MRSARLDKVHRMVLDLQRFPKGRFFRARAPDAKTNDIPIRAPDKLDVVDFRRHHHIFLEGEAHRHAHGNFALDDKSRHDKSAFVMDRETVSGVKSRHGAGGRLQRRRQLPALPARLSSSAFPGGGGRARVEAAGGFLTLSHNALTLSSFQLSQRISRT